jgi:hypothetical protein
MKHHLRTELVVDALRIAVWREARLLVLLTMPRSLAMSLSFLA